MLENTGYVGIAKIEDSLMVGLILGDPVLLIGSPGTAKTMLVRNISKMLGYDKDSTALYSMPTLVVEDVIGYPVPDTADMSAIELKYASTPATIWNKKFLFLDEVNRCRPEVQNTMLQLIRERQCFGIDVDIKYIFSAQNYLTERGTIPLDNALADRFSLFITMPEFDDYRKSDLIKIISNKTEQDSVMLGMSPTVAESKGLNRFLNDCRNAYTDNNTVAQFVYEVIKTINDDREEQNISMRRANIMYRNLNAYLAMMKVKGDSRDIEQCRDDIFKLVYESLPDIATSLTPISATKIKSIVFKAVKVISIDNNSPVAKYMSNDTPIGAYRDVFYNGKTKKIKEDVFMLAINAYSRDNDNKGYIGKDALSTMLDPEAVAIILHVIANEEGFNKKTVATAIDLLTSSQTINSTVINNSLRFLHIETIEHEIEDSVKVFPDKASKALFLAEMSIAFSGESEALNQYLADVSKHIVFLSKEN